MLCIKTRLLEIHKYISCCWYEHYFTLYFTVGAIVQDEAIADEVERVSVTENSDTPGKMNTFNQ